MANAKAFYKNQNGEELRLLLDIDLLSQTIREWSAFGALVGQYSLELDELKNLSMGLSIAQAFQIKRSSLIAEAVLSQSQKAISSLPLWLLHQALDDYLGQSSTLIEQNDVLCLCFGVTRRDLKKEILARSDYDLPQLIAETFATSACGSCRGSIQKSLEDLRGENGLIKGLGHSQSRFDKEGHWIKIKNYYPAELVVYLDRLKKSWMKREEIENLFAIEIENIEGHHVWLSVKDLQNQKKDQDRFEKILMALSDYFKSETGILLFLHLVF